MQKSLIKLHSEGRSYAPNSSQIIGMCNKLGFRQVTSRAQADRAAKGQFAECKGGTVHNFVDWGWEYDEIGNPVFTEWCLNTYSIDSSPCYADRIKSENTLTEYQKNIKPEPKFVLMKSEICSAKYSLLRYVHSGTDVAQRYA